jgi:hypothetical protein
MHCTISFYAPHIFAYWSNHFLIDLESKPSIVEKCGLHIKIYVIESHDQVLHGPEYHLHGCAFDDIN